MEPRKFNKNFISRYQFFNNSGELCGRCFGHLQRAGLQNLSRPIVSVSERSSQPIIETKPREAMTTPLKGLCHEQWSYRSPRWIFLGPLITFCTCTDSFYNFLFLIWKKTQSFNLLLWNYLLILKNPSSNPLHRHKSSNFDSAYTESTE